MFQHCFLLDADAGCGCSWSSGESRCKSRWRGEGAWWILRSLSTSLNTLKRRQNTHCTLYMHIIFLLLAGLRKFTRSWPLLKESALLRDDDRDENNNDKKKKRKLMLVLMMMMMMMMMMMDLGASHRLIRISLVSLDMSNSCRAEVMEFPLNLCNCAYVLPCMNHVTLRHSPASQVYVLTICFVGLSLVWWCAS